jgi:hypothetical protein
VHDAVDQTRHMGNLKPFRRACWPGGEEFLLSRRVDCCGAGTALHPGGLRLTDSRGYYADSDAGATATLGTKLVDGIRRQKQPKAAREWHAQHRTFPDTWCTGNGSTSKLSGVKSNYLDLNRRSRPLRGQILRGAKPTDLPVEQPTRFELASSGWSPRRPSASKSR